MKFQTVILGAVLCFAQALWAGEIPVSETDKMIYTSYGEVWTDPGDISQRQVFPDRIDKLGGVKLGGLVNCTFDEEAYQKVGDAGRTPKFWCHLDNGKKIKIKYYGTYNREVQSEILSTGLFRLLGFYSDMALPIEVNCLNCPADPWEYMKDKYRGQSVSRADRKRKGEVVHFPRAMIDIKFKGDDIVSSKKSSWWNWKDTELMKINASDERIAQVDALILLAAFMSYTDNKEQQNDLICPKDFVYEDEKGRVKCSSPHLVVSDMGVTFGGKLNGLPIAHNPTHTRVHYAAWKDKPVWRRAKNCHAFLVPYANGDLVHPKVSEKGRAFLAGLLSQITDKQLLELFQTAGVDYLGTSSEKWVALFKKKADEIISNKCRR